MGFLKLKFNEKKMWRQKMGKDPLETLKIFEKKTKIENFEQCHSAKKCKGGPFEIF